MKRIVWLLFAVFCSTLARVQPVEIAPCSRCACCHCEVPGDCGVPCNRAPTQALAVFAAEQGSLVARPAASKARAAQPSTLRFYASFVEWVSHPVALIASASAARAANVPLFKAHCSFLT
jgi:hypothetical protein